ncbi:catalase family protein [Ginsengibacter hankyongi]|uniref:Catalase family protein n=1 Tax=Ginsengibacter hankyongi TaxID=2607284 RepID=A0A5J5IP33_9BACT|nr:catalase family protein [Ginsengibacter hankyongi]KAA9041262.1 catalase family protein [Ginsengibacter hankyongi]
MKSTQAKNKTLLPGQEYPEKNEEQIAGKIVELLQKQMLRLYNKNNQKQLRQIHPKMNGCVKAEFIVDKNLPDELRVGIFKEATCFPAWIRFSNGDTKPLPDWKKDIRGFAIKIMNVPGKKIVESKRDGGNHDFILMNTQNFVSKKVNHFFRILKVVTVPYKPGTFFPKLFSVIRSVPILVRATKAKIKCDHPFSISYFSTVPYRFGDKTKAVKYAVIPSEENKLVYTDSKNKDFLRANMVATLSKYEVTYGFFIQFQTDPEKMPIEDPTVVWDSPLVKVATIRIPTQVFDTPEQNDFGDNLSFNSWHALPEHQPLGNFNRVRKKIYEEMYAFRHKHNKIKDVEPSANSDFFNGTNINQHG